MDIQKHIPDYSSLTSELEKNIRRKKAAAGARDLAGFISVLCEACSPTNTYCPRQGYKEESGTLSGRKAFTNGLVLGVGREGKER